MRFEIDWASLIVGRKFTVFALFDFVFEGNFPSTSPRGAYIWRSDLTDVFFCVTKFVGLIHGGAYFRNFPVLLVGCFDVVVLILSSVSPIFSITSFADRTIYNS